MTVDMLFVFPPAPTEGTFNFHLGAGYVQAFLQQHGFTTDQVTTSKKITVPEIVEEIFQYNPDVIGFTCYDWNYYYVRLLVRVLKRKGNPKIVVGGPTATFSAEKILKHTPEIDICVRGEGESPTLKLLQTQFNNIHTIKGISFCSNGTIVSTPPYPLISSGKKEEELDVIPSPYLTGIIPPGKNTGILTSRGCVYSCTYCNFSAMFNHTIRYHSIDRVIQELKYIQGHWNNPHFLTINDDTFTLDVNRAKKICTRIIEEDIHIPLQIETRPDTCDEELIHLLKKAGVIQISLGVESACPSVLQKAQKAPGKEKKFLKKVKLCTQWAKDKDMTVWVSAIFGLPGENMKNAQKTLEFIKELPVDGYIHNILSVYEGTELFSKRDTYGLEVKHSPFFLPYVTEHSYDVSKILWLPGSQIERQIATWKRTYANIVSYDTEGNAYQYVVIKKMPDTHTLYAWLKKVCVLPVTILDTTEKLSRSKAFTHLTKLVDQEVPVGSYLMWLNQSEPVLVKYSTIMDLEIPVKEIPFCAQDHGGTNKNKNKNKDKNTKTNNIYTIKNAEDIEAVTTFLNSHQKNGILSLSSKDTSGTIKSACRWGESACPAVSGNILVINGESVLSCVHGGCIGKVGDDIPVLKKNLQNLKKKKEKERNCRGCPVEKTCSHCLFSHPFTDAEFCTLKREYVNTAKVVTLMKLVRYFPGKKISMRLLNGSPLFYKGRTADEKSIDETINGKKQLGAYQLISVDGTAYVFTKDFTLYSLGEEAAIILEAFQIGVHHKDLVTYLCEHAQISQKEALKAISDTKSLAESLKFNK